MKKLISVLVGMLLMTTTAYAADYSPWAEESIEKAVEVGIVPDTLQSDYTNNITRREFCQLAMQTYMAKTGYTIPEGIQTPFTDIDDDYVTAAYTLGIVSGVGNDKFNPDSAITRQEAAVMLNNLAYMAGVDNSNIKEDKFADEEYFADWAEDAIYKVSAIDSGGTPVMTGTGNNKFSPWMNYTREQAVVTMYRLYGCDAVPVLIPQRDDNIYHCNRGNDEIIKFDTVTNTAASLFTADENTGLHIAAVSDDEIYYIISAGGDYRTGTSRETLYKINTDGTGNTQLTPEAVNIYLSHRYIYYSPADAKTTVVRTNLDGTGMVSADFTSIMVDAEWGWCGVWTDIKGIAYVDVNTTFEPESYYYARKIFAYDFSTGVNEEIPEDNIRQWMWSESVTDGEYVYYIYQNVFDPVRMNAQYELHRCSTEGTEDILLYDDLSVERWYYNYYGALKLYKNNLYVQIHNGAHEDYIILRFDEEGNETVIDFPALDRKFCNIIGIVNDRFYYYYLNDADEVCYGSTGLDGTDEVEY